eukprot:3395081-Pyramimonas_sp.AAC.1
MVSSLASIRSFRTRGATICSTIESSICRHWRRRQNVSGPALNAQGEAHWLKRTIQNNEVLLKWRGSLPWRAASV